MTNGGEQEESAGVEQASVYGRLLDFLDRLDAAHVPYRLAHDRAESIRIEVAMPGMLWEVELMRDGEWEIERFGSLAGVETDAALLEELFSAER